MLLYNPVMMLADVTNYNVLFMLSSSPQAVQKSLVDPFPAVARHSPGNSFTLCVAVTVLGSLAPSPHARLFPFGGGLQSTLRFLVKSESLGHLSVFKMVGISTLSPGTSVASGSSLGPELLEGTGNAAISRSAKVT